MKTQLKHGMRRFAGLFILAIIFLAGCSDQGEASRKNFVGKWKSSKLETPLYLYENSDWEIKEDDGTILQYGVWEYKDKKILWSYKIGNEIGHDMNPVLMVTPTKFQVRESDQTVTSFDKLD